MDGRERLRQFDRHPVRWGTVQAVREPLEPGADGLRLAFGSGVSELNCDVLGQ